MQSSATSTPAPSNARRRVVSAVLTLAIVLLTLAASFVFTGQLPFSSLGTKSEDNPRPHVVTARAHTDHHGFYKQKFKDGPSVTRACLECHPNAATQVMHTRHFTWLGDETRIPGNGPKHAAPERIGKRNLLNNFCLSVESNWPRCTNCHAGYGWVDAKFDFSQASSVDCLICHDGTGSYVKAAGGLPAVRGI